MLYFWVGGAFVIMTTLHWFLYFTPSERLRISDLAMDTATELMNTAWKVSIEIASEYKFDTVQLAERMMAVPFPHFRYFSFRFMTLKKFEVEQKRLVWNIVLAYKDAKEFSEDKLLMIEDRYKDLARLYKRVGFVPQFINANAEFEKVVV